MLFHYGFSAAMGGGEYERTPTFDAALAPVETVASPGPIQPALDARAGGGVVELSDSGRFEETPRSHSIPGVRLEWRAANEHRPTLIASGSIDITGGADAEVTLNGLLIAGGQIRILSVLGDALRKLRLVHCTLVPGLSLGIDGTPASPGTPSLLIEQTESPLEIEIDHCIIGAMRAPPNATVLIRHSIVDANSDRAVAYADLDGIGAGGTVSVVNSTIIGTMHTELLKLASNSIFLARTEDGSAPVRSERRQTGCVRFSWLPLEARVPRRYRCQPDLEIAEQIQRRSEIRREHDQRRGTPGDSRCRGRQAGASFHLASLGRSRLWPAAHRPRRNKSAPEPTTKRRWAPFMISFSRSARATSARGCANICASVSKPEFFIQPNEPGESL